MSSNNKNSTLKRVKNTPIKPPKRMEEGPGWFDRVYSFLTHFRRFSWDIIGTLTIVFVLLTFVGMTGLTKGSILTPWADLVKRWLGWGSLLILVSLVILGLTAVRRASLRKVNSFVWWMICYEISTFAIMALLACISGFSLDFAEKGMYGGIIGWGLASIIKSMLGTFPTVVAWLFVLVIFATGGVRFVKSAAQLFTSVLPDEGLPPDDATASEEQNSFDAQTGVDERDLSIPVDELPLIDSQKTLPVDIKPPAKPRKIIQIKPRKKIEKTEAEEENEAPALQPQRSRDSRLPPYNLLIDEPMNRPDERHIHMTAGLLEKSLGDFGIPAKVVGYRVGPTVTQFAVEPGYTEKTTADGEVVRQKVRVSQISTLSRDLALALSASNLRIEAPVPGRSYVGVEVPNSRTSVVRLRPVLESEVAKKVHAPLMLALGRDVSGQPVMADLGRMPHLLIAGTTGSGKSVCIEAITTCLAMNNSPEDLRMVMIDPKMVELVRFNGLPHLYGKVETDLERILGVLRWTIREMDHRYRLLEAAKSRDIDSYNSKMQRKGQAILPRIVVLIDELADLMMSAPDQTEPCLVRLAQLARATGIHLVVATQRPSTDVITGLIKANFPARISFAVASSIDSRVILDTPGAETLLGHGDMLYLNPESGTPQRTQGVWMHDQEIDKVISYWQKTCPDMVNQPAPWEEMLEEDSEYDGADSLVKEAIEIVRHSQRASASMLQRRLRIGYPRAARLMDELEDLGVVGPSQGGGKDREVLIAEDEDQNDDPGDEGDDNPIDET